MEFYINGDYDYAGEMASGTTIHARILKTSESANCSDIQAELYNYHPTNNVFPVDCDFTTLSGTGIVFFMDASNQKLVDGYEISINAPSSGFNIENFKFIYSIETGFIVVLILMVMMFRALRKISPYFF